MTIPSTPRKAGPLLGNGVQTSWPFTFKVFADTDILVTVANALGVEFPLVLGSDYTVTLNPNQETSPGGTVTYLLPSGFTLVITGNIDYDQPLDLPSGGAFSPTALENELDRLTMQIQQLREAVNRAVQAPITSNASGYLPSPQSNALIGWNESETAMQNFPLSDIATGIAFATYRYDTFTGDGTTTSFVLSADPVTLGNIDVSVDGQTYVPGVDHTLVGQNLVFTVAPTNGVEILARYGQGMASGVSGDALDITYQPGGLGAELTTVEAKLREVVSIKDFGAVGDGLTNDTVAIQNAIKAGAWNGWKVFVPNGTYAVDDTLLIGTDGADNFYSVHLEGESAHGSVFLRNAGKGTGPILTVNGFHNIVEKLTLISATSGGAYCASHGVYLRGNPQTGTNGLGTKYNRFNNLFIQRVGVGVQLGNYDVDGFDPDIETNSFHAVNIEACNIGVFINGQNVLHNPFYNCHIVNCRDQLVKQSRGGDLWFERSYFGGMYDYLTSNYNVASSSKILVTAGVVGFVGCRFEDWASATGNATQRFAINANGSAMSIIYLAGNIFTTRDNATTEPSCAFTGSGSAGSVTTKVTLIGNDFGGYVSFDTIDIFSAGNTYRGTGGSTVNGRILSANQKTGTFRDVFLDSNQTMEFPGAKFKRNSSVPVVIERPAVATNSEWLGVNYYDEAGLMWAREGVRVTNSTAAAESAVVLLNARNAGTLREIGIGLGTAAPVAGTWKVGDWVINSSPAVGSPKGWKCTVAGTPGTWVSEGNL